jgi:hypothetical protein
VVQPGQVWVGDNGTGALARRPRGASLPNAKVCAHLIVVRCIRRKNFPQVRLA